jgi:hypothetical protein
MMLLESIFGKVREQIEAVHYLTRVPPGNVANDAVHGVDIKPASGIKLEISTKALRLESLGFTTG